MIATPRWQPNRERMTVSSHSLCCSRLSICLCLCVFVSLCLLHFHPAVSLSHPLPLFYQAYFIFPPLFHFLPNLEIYPVLLKLKLSSLFFLHKKIFLNNIKLFVIFQEIIDCIYLKFQGMIIRNCTHKYD